jgi:hypothetical protein
MHSSCIICKTYIVRWPENTIRTQSKAHSKFNVVIINQSQQEKMNSHFVFLLYKSNTIIQIELLSVGPQCQIFVACNTMADVATIS